jgi:hypothetical protein
MKANSVASRRSFMRRAGAALTGTLAVTAAGTAAARTGAAGHSAGGHSAQQAIEAIRESHRRYLRYVSSGELGMLPALFTPDARVRLNGGVFAGRDAGIRRLYVEHFSRRARPEPVHVLVLDDPHTEGPIAVAHDGASACARFYCFTQMQSSIESSLTLVQMARQQGHPVHEWWEAGCFENAYVQSAEGWRISELRYRTLLDPRLVGRGLPLRPTAVPRFSVLYPLDPLGPDDLESDPRAG